MCFFRAKLFGRLGFTLVELMIVVAIIGILAAIAIPAFLRYIKSTRTAEAEGIMKKMADGSKAYFTSEQKYSHNPDGDQPWHFGTTTQGQPDTNGMPVPFIEYAFPGGEFARFNTTDGWAVSPDPATAPRGGEKQVPHAPAPNVVFYWAMMNKMNISFEDPIYFQYGVINSGRGPDAEMTIAATANMDVSDPEAHQFIQIITVNDGTQEVQVGPVTVENEFR